MLKNVSKISMMLLNVEKNGDKSMINSQGSSAPPKLKNGPSSLTLYSLPSKLSFKDAPNSLKSAKANFSLPLKEETINYQNSVEQEHLKS